LIFRWFSVVPILGAAHLRWKLTECVFKKHGNGLLKFYCEATGGNESFLKRISKNKDHRLSDRVIEALWTGFLRHLLREYGYSTNRTEIQTEEDWKQWMLWLEGYKKSSLRNAVVVDFVLYEGGPLMALRLASRTDDFHLFKAALFTAFPILPAVGKQQYANYVCKNEIEYLTLPEEIKTVVQQRYFLRTSEGVKTQCMDELQGNYIPRFVSSFVG
jgi:hypothetical protein